MQLKKRVKALFARPKRKLAVLVPELRSLREDLERAKKTQDPLREIVRFFDAVSRWHDRQAEILGIIQEFVDVNYGQHDKTIRELHAFMAHCARAGRDEYGWNRTKYGEQVTPDKVFLGNIYGLFTHPVTCWQAQRNEKRGGWGFPGMEHLNAYDVVSEQARQFMISNAGSMVPLIQNLEKLTA